MEKRYDEANDHAGGFRQKPRAAGAFPQKQGRCTRVRQKADRLPYSKTFTSFEFEDFLSQLTPKRFELLRLASKGRLSTAELATAAHRDQSAVSRDVAKLNQLGLVEVEVVTNEGHGRKKIVLPVAATISINASIAAA